ncbi:peptidyl-prolyl cis-trans isomerase [Striga asiatica]|uniref:Peptidyl-prolyl cis-trans isomerase n=1 Tax=Striga asiatica TaxID=4170 RepID=A0A5A7PE57_STRAF|nr:peptidyl-prolyl cis-trans isomerase [Striga asiatica]
MAKAVPETNNTYFFICTTRTKWLANKHVVFGQVVEEYDILKAVENVGSGSHQTSRRVEHISPRQTLRRLIEQQQIESCVRSPGVVADQRSSSGASKFSGTTSGLLSGPNSSSTPRRLLFSGSSGLKAKRNSGPSLRNLASTLNPTLFPPLSNHEDESMTPLMATMQRSTPRPSMYEQLVRGNPMQLTRATNGVQIRGPPTFTGERPVFSVGSSITLAHEKVVVNKGKKYLAKLQLKLS